MKATIKGSYILNLVFSNDRSNLPIADSLQTMRLERPLVFFDLETTGLDVEKDRVIEFAGIKVYPDKRQERYETLVNPGQPLPPEITKLTGITDEMVAGAPAFAEITSNLVTLLRDADVAGYNLGNFDMPMLEAEFRRCSLPMPGPEDRAVIDPLEILKKHEVRTLSWAYAFYLGKARDEGHRSMQDTEAAIEILRTQVKRYGLSGTPVELQAEIRHPYLDAGKRLLQDGDTVKINFGKYRGKALAYVRKTDPDYISWMRENLGYEVAKLLDTV